MPFPSASNLGAHRANPLHACSGAPTKRSNLPFVSYLLLLVFACVLFLPLYRGRSLYWGDILLYFAPMLRWEQTALRQGHIPLWNPAVLSGQPFVGNPQEGVFYPPTLLLPFVPVWLFLSLMIVGHISLCGVFMMRYLHRWTEGWQAAFAGAVVYMGGACLIGRAQFPPMIFTAAYFPLLLCSLDQCLDAAENGEKKRRRLVKTLSNSRSRAWTTADVSHLLASRLRLALAVGLLLLAAHPQFAYMMLTCGSVYAFCRLLAYSHLTNKNLALARVRAWRNLYNLFRDFYPVCLSLVAAAAVGLLLASVQMLPAVQLLLASPREQLTPAQANRFVLEPTRLLTLLLPRFWGHPASADYWGGGNAWEAALFVGWLPLPLIGTACMRALRSRYIGFWIVGALLGVWLALGRVGGLYWVAFRVVPGLSNFHDPARFLLYTTFAFAALTAAGWDSAAKRLRCVALTRGSALAQRWILIAGQSLGLFALAAPLLWYGQEWNPTAPHDLLQRRPARFDALLAAQNNMLDAQNDPPYPRNKPSAPRAGRIYLPAADIFWKRYITEGYRDYGASDPRHIRALIDSALPNISIADGLLSASGYEPVPVSAQTALDGIGRQALRRSEPNLARVTALLNACALLLPGTVTLHDPRFRPLPALQPSPDRQATFASADNLPFSLWSNRDALSFAWMVHHTRQIEGRRRIVAALAAPGFRPDKLAILCDHRERGDLSLEWPDVPALGDDASLESAVKQRRVSRADKRISAASNTIGDTAGHMMDKRASPVTMTTAYSTEMMYDVQYNTEPGMLVMAQTAYPGWKALADGRPAALHRVNASLMGVYLPAGPHRVHLKYQPASYQIGLYLSLMACAICAMTGGVLFGFRQGGRMPSEYVELHN